MAADPTTTTTTNMLMKETLDLVAFLQDAQRERERAGHLKSFTDEDECVKENVVVYQPGTRTARIYSAKK